MQKYLSVLVLAVLFFVSCSNQRQPMSPEALQTAVVTAVMTATGTQPPPAPTSTATLIQTFQVPTLTSTVTATVHAATPTVTPTNTMTPLPSATATATAGDTPGYQNNGRLKVSTLDMPIAGALTLSYTMFYGTDGKIMQEEVSVNGAPGFTGGLSYNGNGKLVSMTSASGQGIDKYFSYDGQGRLSAYYGVDSTPDTLTALVFGYGADNLINRIDQSDSGVPVSYRLVTRDVNGFISREDYYDMSGSQFGYVTYSRDDAQKRITVEFYVWTVHAYTLTVDYDTDGFWKSSACVAHMNPDVTYYTETNVLQAGPFDAGGINGYYYTDKDMYPLRPFGGNTSDGLYPGP